MNLVAGMLNALGQVKLELVHNLLIDFASSFAKRIPAN